MNRLPLLEKEARDFNEKYPVGSEVLLMKDFQDDPIVTKVESAAYVLSGHTAVAFFENVSGCYSINSVVGKPDADF